MLRKKKSKMYNTNLLMKFHHIEEEKKQGRCGGREIKEEEVEEAYAIHLIM